MRVNSFRRGITAALFDVAGKSVGRLGGNPVARRYISDHPDNRFVEGKLRANFCLPSLN